MSSPHALKNVFPSHRSLNWVWDTNLLDWVVETQPSGGGGGGGAVTIADGANVVEGSTTDALVGGDSDGTINARLRAISTDQEAVMGAVGSVSYGNATLFPDTPPNVAEVVMGGMAVKAGSKWTAAPLTGQDTDDSLNVSITQGFVDPLIGQQTMVGSLPVVIASDQTAVPVSGTVTTSPPNNASTNLTQVGGSSISLGQKVDAASLPVVLPADQITALAPTKLGLTISTLNSSNTPLPAHTTFTGTFEDVSAYAIAVIGAESDSGTQTGAAVIRWSQDGVTVWKQFTTPLGGNTQINTWPLVLTVIAKYLQVEYTNSASFDMTFFHLQTAYSVAPIQQNPLFDLGQGQDTIPTTEYGIIPLRASVLIGKDLGSGNFNHVVTDASGILTVKINDGVTPFSIKQGNVPPNVGDTAIVTTQRDPLPTGTNVLGKVGIDQTTPGTTNKVSIGSDGSVTVLGGTLAATIATLPLPTGAAVETGGNLDVANSLSRARNQLLVRQLQLQMAQPMNGFVPMEIPAFLAG
jgi:hypothetical protein